MIEIPTATTSSAGELTGHITRPPSTCQPLTPLALHNIKVKIMLTILNVYECLFGILIRMFYYLFGWEMRQLPGSLWAGGGVIMTSFGPSLGG